MTKTQDSLSTDHSIRIGLFFGLIFWVAALALVGFNWMRLPPEIPWFYLSPWGEEQLIQKSWLLLVIVLFGVILILDAILARVLGNDEELLRRILIWGGVASELLMLLSLIRVIMVIL